MDRSALNPERLQNLLEDDVEQRLQRQTSIGGEDHFVQYLKRLAAMGDLSEQAFVFNCHAQAICQTMDDLHIILREGIRRHRIDIQDANKLPAYQQRRADPGFDRQFWLAVAEFRPPDWRLSGIFNE